MKYVIRGSLRGDKNKEVRDIDEFDNLESAKKELAYLRLQHPVWFFWISEENEKVSPRIRTEPEHEIRS